MTYRGHVKGGVIVLDLPSQLPEGTLVRVEAVVEAVDPPEDLNNPMIRMLNLAVETGIPDLATNIDHYLYGHPKVDDAE